MGAMVGGWLKGIGGKVAAGAQAGAQNVAGAIKGGQAGVQTGLEQNPAFQNYSASQMHDLGMIQPPGPTGAPPSGPPQTTGHIPQSTMTPSGAMPGMQAQQPAPTPDIDPSGQSRGRRVLDTIGRGMERTGELFDAINKDIVSLPGVGAGVDLLGQLAEARGRMGVPVERVRGELMERVTGMQMGDRAEDRAHTSSENVATRAGQAEQAGLQRSHEQDLEDKRLAQSNEGIRQFEAIMKANVEAGKVSQKEQADDFKILADPDAPPILKNHILSKYGIREDEKEGLLEILERGWKKLTTPAGDTGSVRGESGLDQDVLQFFGSGSAIR